MAYAVDVGSHAVSVDAISIVVVVVINPTFLSFVDVVVIDRCTN